MLGEAKLVSNQDNHPLDASALFTKGMHMLKPRSRRDMRPGSNRSNRTIECPLCTYCNKTGHTQDKCYKLHGYPSTNKTPKDSKAQYAMSSSIDLPSSSEDALNFHLTKAQLETLHQLLNHPSANCSPVQGTGIREDDWQC
ncbi:uncharacterized protein LOC122196162 [Lactuca sativa]|uniref:uncharacterized protein LOC122196162 n=1 Tax=Lactuca sativa TaxID=4236 RepID=UPI001C68C6BA|nr:uncharacterized protein LOC122196162 [Lactuca sativa]